MPKPRTRTRRSKAEWAKIFNRFESSGLTARQFCRRERLALSSFQRWRSRLGSTTSPEFVELVPAETVVAPTSDWTLEIALPNGAQLRIRG